MAAGRDAPLERATGARSAPMPRVFTSAWRNSLVKSTAAPSASQVPPETSRVEELDALSEILGDFRAEGDELVIDTEKRVEKNKLREDIQAPTIFAHTHYASPPLPLQPPARRGTGHLPRRPQGIASSRRGPAGTSRVSSHPPHTPRGKVLLAAPRAVHAPGRLRYGDRSCRAGLAILC